MPSSKRAMTLVELLVVLVILVLVAGIVFAAVGPAREKARQTTCAGNLRQIHQALMMYCQDHDGIEPVGAVTATALGLPPMMAMGKYANGGPFTELYLKDPRLWICPNDDCSDPARHWPECRADPRKCCNSYVLPQVNWQGCQENVPGCFPTVVARCGARLPLMSCYSHGFHKRVSNYQLVLRWDGQVDRRYVLLPLTPCLD